MDSGTNSTEIGVDFVPVMKHDMACLLMVLTLTLIAMGILCMVYRIAADGEIPIQDPANQMDNQGIAAPYQGMAAPPNITNNRYTV